MIDEIIDYYETLIPQWNFSMGGLMYGVVAVTITVMISFITISNNDSSNYKHCYTKPITDSLIIKTVVVQARLSQIKKNTIFLNKYAYENADTEHSAKFDAAFSVECMTPQELDKEYYKAVKAIKMGTTEVLIFETSYFGNEEKFSKR